MWYWQVSLGITKNLEDHTDYTRVRVRARTHAHTHTHTCNWLEFFYQSLYHLPSVLEGLCYLYKWHFHYSVHSKIAAATFQVSSACYVFSVQCLVVISSNGDSLYCFCAQGFLSLLTDKPLTTWPFWPSFYNFYMSCIDNIYSSSSIVMFIIIATGTCLQSSCLATNVFFGSTILAFKCHVTIVKWAWMKEGVCNWIQLAQDMD
jgi:hypothetical protein